MGPSGPGREGFGAHRRPRGELPWMIRGGGAPNKGMAPESLFRLDPPPRSFAADAHGCIMVRAPRGPPDTSSRRDDPRPTAWCTDHGCGRTDPNPGPDYAMRT